MMQAEYSQYSGLTLPERPIVGTEIQINGIWNEAKQCNSIQGNVIGYLPPDGERKGELTLNNGKTYPVNKVG